MAIEPSPTAEAIRNEQIFIAGVWPAGYYDNSNPASFGRNVQQAKILAPFRWIFIESGPFKTIIYELASILGFAIISNSYPSLGPMYCDFPSQFFIFS